jgi:hypothetical protein
MMSATPEEIADRTRREQAAMAAAEPGAEVSRGPKTIAGMAKLLGTISAKLKSIASESRTASRELANVEKAATRTRQTAKEAIADARSQREADAIAGLSGGVTGMLWDSWWQIAQVDANSHGLIALETEMRRYSGLDIAFLSRMRRELARVQQLNKTRSRGGGGALNQQQATEFLGQYTGGGS